MMFSSFSSAVLLLHNQTQSICATPITFFERGELERARHSLRPRDKIQDGGGYLHNFCSSKSFHTFCAKKPQDI